MNYETWKNASDLVNAEEIREKLGGPDVISPAHYNRNGIEAIEGIRASMSEVEFLGYLKGNIIKYLWRYGYKEKPKEDLRKATWYLNYMLKITDDYDNKELSKILKDLK